MVMYYKEAKDGQILEEGITEAGAMASFTAAGTAYANYGVPMIPFYIYYSMFGYQRVGDLVWAFGDSRGKGFLIGGTAGRTTLTGEGLQHTTGTARCSSAWFRPASSTIRLTRTRSRSSCRMASAACTRITRTASTTSPATTKTTPSRPCRKSRTSTRGSCGACTSTGQRPRARLPCSCSAAAPSSTKRCAPSRSSPRNFRFLRTSGASPAMSNCGAMPSRPIAGTASTQPNPSACRTCCGRSKGRMDLSLPRRTI